MLSAVLSRRLGGFTLDAKIEADADSTLVLVGESGSGKSTVLRLLAGLDQPDGGTISVDGVTWFDHAQGISLPARERLVGWVPQDYALLPHLSVFENVAFGLRARRQPADETRRRTVEALDRLGIAELALRKPVQLSGGQQQRVAVARAVVLEPRLLLLDEPLAALDLQTRSEVRGELRALLRTLPTITVFVTHSPLEAVVFGHRIAVLEAGRIVQSGPPGQLLERPRSPYVAAFMGLNLFQGRVTAQESGGVARVSTADGSLLVSGAKADVELFLAVGPRDITLFGEQPPIGSAQNVYRGRVLEMIPEPPFGERVRVVLGTKPRLVAEITRAAVQQLKLAEGNEVFASFKATAVSAYA